MTATSPPPGASRTIRSYVLRAGRITLAQRRALHELWRQFAIEEPGPLDLAQIFGRRAPVVMEIGFGDGDVLTAMAQAHPERDFLGVEVHEPGIGHCLLRIESLNLPNVRLMRGDAVGVLARQLASASLSQVNLFFPDPWPKKRHHKRRLVQPAFVQLVVDRLAPGGVLHVATDWAPYAAHMDEVLGGQAQLEPGQQTLPRPKTKFERRGERLGHAVTERVFRRCPIAVSKNEEIRL